MTDVIKSQLVTLTVCCHCGRGPVGNREHRDDSGHFHGCPRHAHCVLGIATDSLLTPRFADGEPRLRETAQWFQGQASAKSLSPDGSQAWLPLAGQEEVMLPSGPEV